MRALQIFSFVFCLIEIPIELLKLGAGNMAWRFISDIPTQDV